MKKIVGVILAAGTSSRFNSNIPKQLYIINNKCVLQYSIDSMCDFVDEIIIVINKNIKFNCTTKKCKITFIENDINKRIESLNKAIFYIKNLNNIKNIIIHDGARPFVSKQYFENLIFNNEKNNMKYSQYALKLTNGLYKIKQNSTKIGKSRSLAARWRRAAPRPRCRPVNRDEYIELCTPICISYDLLKIQKTEEILDSINISPNFLYGNYKQLKKITTIDDL